MFLVRVRECEDIKLSRLVMYVREGVRFDRRDNFENNKDTMCRLDTKMVEKKGLENNLGFYI